MLPKFWFWFAIASLLAVSGCTKSSCDLGEQFFTFSEGRTRTTFADGTENVRPAQESLPSEDAEKTPLFRIYESAPWSGPLQNYRSDTTVTFIHGLGVVPELVQSYVSYSENGIADFNVTENAGDQGLIECVDDKVIVLKDNTCLEKFWVRVVATASGGGSEQTVVPCKESKSLSDADPDSGAAGSAVR